MKNLWGLLALCLLGLLASPAEAKGDRVLFYAAYGDTRNLWVEGRLVEDEAERPAAETDSRWRNLRRGLRRLSNDERKNRPLALHVGDRRWETRTDSEGYFRLEVEHALPTGWQRLQADGRIPGEGEALIVPPENRRGLISDIDDTVMVSEVLDKPRLLANTFLKNAAQRQAVPGVADRYARLSASNPVPAATPLFYLSASPRQLQAPIADFLARHGFPPGVLVTKRISDDRQSDPWLDQIAYKTRKIEEIFARLPNVRFILAGDDGEQDPETYDGIRQRYPERVEAIWIRRVHPDPARPRFPGQEDLP